jgi:hypothetical protein
MATITTAIVITNPIEFSSIKDFTFPSMKKKNDLEYSQYFDVWDANSIFSAIDRNGTISGTVKVQGVLQNKARVSLYFRKTGALIQSTFTDKNGVFEFACGLNRNVADYYAVAITEQPFNAQVFDKLQPI